LRGPLCGLVLSDLHALCVDSGRVSLMELAQQAERVALMSADGQQRLQRFLSEVLPAVYRAPRTEIVPWVEALWLRLGGPSVCLDDVDRDAAERALARLAALEQSTGLWQRQSVTQAMESLYAGENSDPVAQRVQLMTLHKSKGLEFGTVILPALGRQGRGDDRRLLDWYESTVDGRPSLLLAPIDAPGIHDSQRSAIGRLLRRFKSRADEAERLRQAPFKRSTATWTLPALDTFVWQYTPPLKLETAAIDYDWQGSTARDVGTAVHRELQRLADVAHSDRVPPGSEDLGRITRQLRTLGVVETSLDDAVAQVTQAVRNTLDDERGRWTLHNHEDARSEWALSVPRLDAGRIVGIERIIIDRTFIDEGGTRWIVDYKTGSHAGGDLEAFLDREVERYREQLETVDGESWRGSCAMCLNPEKPNQPSLFKIHDQVID